jgi:hypothetical protein
MVDQELGRDGLDWIEQAQYRDMWRTLVHALMNLRVPKPWECLDYLRGSYFFRKKSAP